VTLALLSGIGALMLAAADWTSAAPQFAAPARLPPGGEQPRVAIGPGGQLAAVWMHGSRNTANNALAHPNNNEIAADTGLAFGDVWQTPTLVSMPGFSVLPQVTVDPQGDAAAIWQNFYPQEGAIDASYRLAASGVWSAPVAISAPGERGTDVQIALEPNGDAVGVWDRLGQGPSAGIEATEVAVRSAATGTWAAPKEFPAANHPGQLKIAADGRGDLFAAWISEERVEATMQPYGSAAWQEPQRLSPAAPPDVAIGNLDLAVSAAGDAAVLWQQEPAECRLGAGPPCVAFASQTVRLVSSVRMASSSEWTPPAELPAAGVPEAPVLASPEPGVRVGATRQTDAEIAIDARGDAVATWLEHGLQASVRPAASGLWQTPSRLSESAYGFPYGARYLAVDATGQALVTWSADRVIQGSVGSATTGAWQPPVDVTPENACGSVGEPHVAVDPAGDAVLLWSAGSCTGPDGMQAITFNLAGGVPGYRPPEPELTNVTMSSERFRVLRPRKRARTRAHPGIPLGTRFRFAVFPDAWVRIAIEHLAPGDRQGSTCIPSRTPPGQTSCTIASVVTTIERREDAGIHSTLFDGNYPGRLPEGASALKKAPRPRLLSLAPGQYAAVLTASNTSGTSWPVTYRFTVVR
jgi:hypothetical protein